MVVQLILDMNYDICVNKSSKFKQLVYSQLTNIRANPITYNPTKDASHLPTLCPKGPNKFVPIRYDMDAGRNAAPSCHFSAPILSIIKMGNDGSSIAIPMFANVIAPKDRIEVVL